MERKMEREVKRVLLGTDSAITSLGRSSEELLSRIEQYHTGCRRIDDQALFGKPFVAGRLDTELLTDRPADGLNDLTLLERLFVATISDVLARSGVDAGADDTLLVISSTKGNIELLDSRGAHDERVFIGNMATRIAAHTGFKNNPVVISNACISGLSAIIAAARLMWEGPYRNVIVAGGDLLTRFVVTGFHAFRSISKEICRPYDASRDGLTLGEGCGALLLTVERNKAVQPYVEVAGGAISGDANHISGPSRTGDGLYFAIRNAMFEANILPSDVGFVNGHGTGTVYNDEMESKALALAGLDAVPVTGLKPWFGHTLGAAGVVETIVCAHGLRTGTVFGTPGFTKSGTPHPLNISAAHRKTDARVCVKTASGFGGCNAAIVLRLSDRYETSIGTESACNQQTSDKPASGFKTVHKKAEPHIRKTASVRITPESPPFDRRPFGEAIRERFKALNSPDIKFFKMDDLSKLGYVAASELLAKAAHSKDKYSPDSTGIVFANRSASLDTDIKHCAQMERNPDEVSPAIFVYTLPNICAAEISIRHKIQGESTFFIQAPNDGFVERYARMLLRQGRLKAVVYGRCELLGDRFDADMTLLETE